jgi:predicted Zn finger-like uncharacterized protein
MRIVCPSCAAAYDVPDSLVTPGRVVRCARCGDEWTPLEGTPPSAGEPDPERDTMSSQAAEPEQPTQREYAPPRFSAMDRLAAHPVPLRSRQYLRLAWAASLLIIGLAFWGAYAWRSQIMEMWPPSARLYVALGIQSG